MGRFLEFQIFISSIILGSLSGFWTDLRGQDFLVADENIELLNSKSVQAMLQDQMGFIWFGSNEGLFRYNGSEVKGYYYIRGDSTSLSSNFISTIYEDKDGLIWIGTISGGLNRFDPVTEKFTRFKNNPLKPTSISVNSIHRIYEDQFGNIWLATFGGGINFLSNTEKQKNNPNFKKLNQLREGRLVDIVIDKEKNIWVTSSENYIFHGELITKIFQTFNLIR